MREWLKKVLGGIFLVSSALGLIGLPADLPTWYRCARYRGSYCPDMSALWPPEVDLAVLFNTAFLLVGILLLLPPNVLRVPALFGSSMVPAASLPLRSSRPTISPPTKRVVVDVEPDYLIGLFKGGQTSLEGERLAAPYIGKWIRVAGEVKDVSRNPFSHGVTFANREIGNAVFMMFRLQSEVPLLLRKGQTVTVLGCIDSISQHDVTLHDCEVVG